MPLYSVDWQAIETHPDWSGLMFYIFHKFQRQKYALLYPDRRVLADSPTLLKTPSYLPRDSDSYCTYGTGQRWKPPNLEVQRSYLFRLCQRISCSGPRSNSLSNLSATKSEVQCHYSRYPMSELCSSWPLLSDIREAEFLEVSNLSAASRVESITAIKFFSLTIYHAEC